ncbi:MAG: hypothetical protein R3B74_12210 [Nitrospirales bacterium]|nr:hypothetical protein [Nitrospirales bacterium]
MTEGGKVTINRLDVLYKVEKKFTRSENLRSENFMKQKITYWKESDGKYLGYLNDYPEHWTQGENLEDLKEHLLDLYKEFSKDDLPGIKKVEEIEVG